MRRLRETFHIAMHVHLSYDNSMNHAPARDINDYVSTTTEGVLTKVTDFILAELYFRAIAPPKWRTKTDGPSALADRVLKPKTVTRALVQLTSTGMVQRVAADKLPSLTYKGKDRLESILPRSDREPSVRLHLVAYDIPRTGNVTRNRIRDMLLKAHAVPVLDSLWLSPIDPTDALAEATGGRDGGSFFVTSLSPDATVNGKPVRDLVDRIYRTGELALRYEAFLAAARHPETPAEVRNLRYLYLSVAAADPHLPPEFLPQGFPGTKAARRFRELTRP
jgi:DNA-binding transcriptional regulator PaaX